MGRRAQGADLIPHRELVLQEVDDSGLSAESRDFVLDRYVSEIRKWPNPSERTARAVLNLCVIDDIARLKGADFAA